MARKRLTQSFYTRDAQLVARELLNKVIVAGSCAARIVEVEAYEGERDPASHAYRGETPRNAVMFDRGGLLYVYFTYGMHFCMNVVTGDAGVARAVLLRAAEPIDGLAVMRRRRGEKIRDIDLCRGPARLTQAFGIARAQNGLDLTTSPRLFIADDGVAPPKRPRRSARVGIKAGIEHRWRYFLDSPYVSGPRG